MHKFTAEEWKMILRDRQTEQEERRNNIALNDICKECGRYKKIPIHFCTECWKDMKQEIV